LLITEKNFTFSPFVGKSGIYFYATAAFDLRVKDKVRGLRDSNPQLLGNGV